MRKIWITGFIVALCLTAACSASPGDGLSTLCQNSGLDLSVAKVVSDQNGHGGFHGDGTRLTVLAFEDDRMRQPWSELDGNLCLWTRQQRSPFLA